MKKTFQRRFLIGLTIFVVLFGIAPSPAFAASTVYLTPQSGKTNPGSTFTVSVDGFVGSSFLVGTHSAKGSLSFPSNLLKVTSISTKGDTFTNNSTITPDNAAGSIDFSESNNWWQGVNSTTVHLFAVTFQAVATGTATIKLNDIQYSSGTGAAGGGTYTIVAPDPAASTSTTEETVPNPTSESDGGLKIENVTATTTRQENSVAWSLNDSSVQPTFSYGTTKDSQDHKAAVEKLEDGSYMAKLEDLKLGSLYYFTIKASTDSLHGATYGGVLATRGYPVKLTIEQNGLFIPGAKVQLGNRQFVANNDAVIITELGEGNYDASVTPSGSTSSHNAEFTVQKLAIPDNGDPSQQSYTLNIATIGNSPPSGGSLLPIVIGVLAVIAAVSGSAGFIFLRRRKNTAVPGKSDGDLLAASYGKNIEQLRQHTPQPNLEATPISHEALIDELPVTPAPPVSGPPTIVNTASAPSMPALNQTPPLAPTRAPTPTNIMAQPSSDPTLAPPVDALAPPLPPAANLSPAERDPAPVSNDSEQLSSDVTRVESSEQIPYTDEGPSAIYDERTGELAIIHHHAAQQLVVTQQSVETEAPGIATMLPSQSEEPPLQYAEPENPAPQATNPTPGNFTDIQQSEDSATQTPMTPRGAHP